MFDVSFIYFSDNTTIYNLFKVLIHPIWQQENKKNKLTQATLKR